MINRRSLRMGCAPPCAATRPVLYEALEDRLLFDAAPLPSGSPELQQSGVLNTTPPASVADLTTNDTGDNTATLNALLAQNSVVVLPSGVIRVTLRSALDGPTLVVPEGKTLQGQADGSTILNFVTDGTVTRTRGIELRSNATLDHLTIQQTGQTLADGHAGILVYAIGRQDVTIRNTALRGPSLLVQANQLSRTEVLYVQDTTRFTLENSSARGAQAHYGAEFLNSQYVTITNCDFSHNGWDGLKLVSNSGMNLHATISDSVFHDNGQSAAQFQMSNGNGADVNGRFIHFVNCVAYGNYGAGFQVKAASVFVASDITFTNCESYDQRTVGGGGQHGFAVVWGGTNPSIEPPVERIQFIDSHAHHNDGSGFWIGANTRYVTVRNSISHANDNAGMIVQSNTLGHVIEGFQGYGNGAGTDINFNLVIQGGAHHRLYDIFLSGIDPVDQNLASPANYAGNERSMNLGVYADFPGTLNGGLVDLIIYGIRTEYAKVHDIYFGPGVSSANPSQFQLIQRTFALSGAASGYVGLPVSLQLSSNFTSLVTTGYQTRIDWNGDGQDDEVLQGTVPSQLTHTFSAAGSQTVRVTVISPRGLVAQATHQFTTVDLPALPTLAITGPTSGNEGQQMEFVLGSFSGSPPAGQSYRYDVDWDGNGSIDQVFNGGANLTAGYTFLNAGTRQIAVTVTDIHQRQVTGTLQVNVVANPTAPEFTIAGPSTTETGQPLQLTISKSQDATGPYTMEVDWNGDQVVDELQVSGASVVTLQHVYTQAGSATVSISLINGSGQRTTHTHNVLVVAPETLPNFAIQAPSSVTAGELVTFSVALEQPSSQSYQLRFDWNGDGQIDQTVTGGHGFTMTRSFATPGSHVVQVTMVDGRGNWKLAQHTLTVAVPPPPVLTLSAPPTITRSQVFTLELHLSRTAQVTIDWDGNGAFDDTFVASGTVRLSHALLEPGETEIVVRATDSYGQIVQEVATMVVHDIAVSVPPIVPEVPAAVPPVPAAPPAPAPSRADLDRATIVTQILGQTSGNLVGLQQAVPLIESRPTFRVAPEVRLDGGHEEGPVTSAAGDSRESRPWRATTIDSPPQPSLVRTTTHGQHFRGPASEESRSLDAQAPGHTPAPARARQMIERSIQERPVAEWWNRIRYQVEAPAGMAGNEGDIRGESAYVVEMPAPPAIPDEATTDPPPTEGQPPLMNPVEAELPWSDLPLAAEEELLGV